MKNKILGSQSGLASQFISYIAVIIITSMSIDAYYQYKSESDIINRTLHAQGKSLGELLASISVDALLVYDDVTLNDYAKFASLQNNIVFSAVVNKDKVSLTHFLNDTNNYVKNIPGAVEAVDIQPVLDELRMNKDILFVETPVVFNGEVLAYSWVGMDRKPYLEQSKNNLIKIILVTVFLGLFIAVGIILLFRYKIFNPIELLIESTRNISKFEFESPVVIKGKGELSILADSFDKMRGHLKDVMETRNRVMLELSELNESLEERVYKRTSELQMLNSKIAHQAMHDPLTGLPNRLLLAEKLDTEISHAVRDETKLAVFMIDLNNFKDVNDTLGHSVGDGLLKDVAQRIKFSLRSSDTVCRLGGDEFAVVLPDANCEDAIKIAKKVLENLEPSFNLDNHIMKIGASIGVSIFPDHGDDHTSLIRLADVAMYDAKKNSRHISMYNIDLDKYTKSRLALMHELDEAIKNNQLELYYQPKVSLHNGRVLSVEALIRWNHPERGLIMPDEFIPFAEDSTLINELSYWVVKHAYEQWREWRDRGVNLQIAVNLSAHNFVDPNLPVFISKCNKKYDMQETGIKLEITESTIMSNVDGVMNVMADPNMKNIQYSIDDFGTGYSSLSYLKKLTVSEVKIDRTFVSDMSTDEDDECIVRSVIDLAHNLGHNVVAEGVETREVLQQLIDMSCDEVQGYYFSKPVAHHEIVSVINRIENDFQSNVEKVSLS